VGEDAVFACLRGEREALLFGRMIGVVLWEVISVEAEG